MSKKEVRKKLIYAALAAIAGGGILYAVAKSKEEEEEGTGGVKTIPVTPSGSGSTEPADDVAVEDDLGGTGGGGGGGGGGGLGGDLRMCLGMTAEGERDVQYVAGGEECPEGYPYDTEEELEEAIYDAFRCYDIDEEGELVEQEKAIDEVCAEVYPEFPFETRNDALLYQAEPESYEGCTDPEAINFSETAIFDDGSCEMPVEGCMLEDALNFDPEANVEANDTCEFAPEEVLGCTSESADNFDAEATADDGSCAFSRTCYAFIDGVYQLYDTQVAVDSEETMCVDLPKIISTQAPYFELGYYDTEEQAQAFFDGYYQVASGSENEPELTTCYFYNPDSGDIGNGEFELAEGEGCQSLDMPPATFWDTPEEAEQAYIDEVLAFETQSCYSYDSEGVFILDDLPVISEDTSELIGCEELGYFDLSIAGENEAQNAFAEEYAEELSEEEELPSGLIDKDVALVVAQECPLWTMSINAEIVNLPFVTPDYPNAISIAQVNNILGYQCFDSSTGEIIAPAIEDFGCTDPTASNFDSEALADDGSCQYDDGEVGVDTDIFSTDDGEDPLPILGCTDPEADNFDSNADTDDGSCEYSEVNTEVEPTGINETNEVLGCTDPEAENYNSEANVNDGTCEYPLPSGIIFMEDALNLVSSNCPIVPSSWQADILGLPNVYDDIPSGISISQVNNILGYECLDPSTGEIIAPSIDEFGCTDPTASNFDAEAIADDGSCQYDDGEVGVDTDIFSTDDGIDPLPILGCTDPQADNFDSNADTDDGSCEYSEVNTEVEPTGINETNEVLGCMDAEADNFDPSATTDDGSCEYGLPLGLIEADEAIVVASQSCPLIPNDLTQEILSLPSPFEEYPSAVSIAQVNNILGYQCFGPEGEIIAPPIEDFGCTDPTASNFDPEALADDGSCQYDDGEVGVDTDIFSTDDSGGSDTSAFVTDEQFSLLSECGNVPSDVLLGIMDSYQSNATSANTINEALGFVCYDPQTGMHLFAEVVPEEAVESGTEAQNILLACYAPDFPPMDLLTNVSEQTFPMMPSDFNSYIGWDCLNEAGDIVGNPPVTPEPVEPNNDFSSELDESISVDDASDPVTPEPTPEIGLRTGDIQDDSDDASNVASGDDIKKNFANFVNSKNVPSGAGCTDPMAWNYNESATIDDGSCDY